MKALKISLFVIVALTIGYFVYQSIDCCKLPEALRFSQDCNCEEVTKVEASGNVYFDQVKQQIQQLKSDSKVGFQKGTFLVIEKSIDDHAQAKRISTADKNALHLDLFRTYVEGFIVYSMKIFRNTEWKNEDISHIRNEFAVLLNSEHIQEGSIRSDIEEISSVIASYDNANSIISQARSYNPPMDLNESFHSDGKIDMLIATSKSLQNDIYLKNCSRVVNALQEIPSVVYNNHFAFLKSKIGRYAGRYEEYNSQPAYVSNVYQPLKSEIDSFYTLNDFPDTHAKYKILEADLDQYNNQAFTYFNP